MESTRLLKSEPSFQQSSFQAAFDDPSNLVRIYVQHLPPSLFGLTDWDAEPFYAQHLAMPLGAPVNGTDLTLLNTSQNALGTWIQC